MSEERKVSRATAPGKVILFGEHAVVYGRPAIAIPVTQVGAVATVEAHDDPAVWLVAPDLGRAVLLSEAEPDNPLAMAVRGVLTAVALPAIPPCKITVTSSIPIASGLGSGAAITAAVIRALAHFLGHEELLDNERVSALTYEVEKIHHGTPSGIDNTVVSYGRPVYFVRQEPQNRIETFAVGQPLRWLIADTGVRSSTKIPVGDVRRLWEAKKRPFEELFDACGRIAIAARRGIEQGDMMELGQLMLENHELLQDMTVSSPELDTLVRAAMKAGALGAKLSGAGRGGNMIALVTLERETAVREALLKARAKTVLATTLEKSE